MYGFVKCVCDVELVQRDKLYGCVFRAASENFFVSLLVSLFGIEWSSEVWQAKKEEKWIR